MNNNNKGHRNTDFNGFQRTTRGGRGRNIYSQYASEGAGVFNKTISKPIRRHRQSMVFSTLAKKLVAEDSKAKYLDGNKDLAVDYQRLLVKDSTTILDKIVYPKNYKCIQEKRIDSYLKTTTALNQEKRNYLKGFIFKEFPLIFDSDQKKNKNWRDAFTEEQLMLFKLYERCNSKQHCGDNLKPLIASTNLNDTIYVSLDLEEFENSRKITEIGITIYDPRENGFYDSNGLYHSSIAPHFRTYHIIIKERVTHRNKRFIFCKKQESLFNETYILDINNTHKFLQSIWDKYFNNKALAVNGFKVALVGQSVMGDIRSLKKEFNLKEQFEFTSAFSTSFKQEKNMNLKKNSKAKSLIVKVYDTEQLSKLILSDSISVKKQLRFLNIPHTALHNALNDSYYTLLSFMKMTDIDSRINLKLDDPIKLFQNFSHLMLLNNHTSVVIPLEIAYLLEKEEKNKLYENGEESKSVRKLNKLTQQLEFGLPLDIDTYLDIPY